MSEVGHPAQPAVRQPAKGKNWTRGYAPAQALGRVVVVLLSLVILADLVSIGALQSRIDVVHKLESGAFVTPAQLSRADDRVGLTVLLWLAGLVLTGIAFVWWFQRVYGNLPALGARDLRFGHGWSIGAWFVPVLNLMRPVQIAHDTWQASDPGLDGDPADWRSGARGTVVGWWWGAFLISGVVDRIASSRPTSTADEIVSADRMLIVSNLIDVLAAALAIVLVVTLTRRQAQARAARLARAGF